MNGPQPQLLPLWIFLALLLGLGLVLRIKFLRGLGPLPNS